MNEIPVLALSGIAGIVLGGMFYGGLWWTVRRGLRSARPGLWFLASSLLRMAIALGGLYAVSGGDWRRLFACLLGFVVGRILVTWLTRAAADNTADNTADNPARQEPGGQRAT
jgi:F1F0 ATPase subunit 2